MFKNEIINYWYFVCIWCIWSVCFCQNKFSTVYVNNFTFIQVDQREVKKKSTSKVSKIKKEISNGKSSKGKSLNKDKVGPMVDNKVPKTPPKKQKKKVYRPTACQSPRKRVKQDEHGPDEWTDEEENILDYSSDEDLESSNENEAELGKLESGKELWKEKNKFNFICINCSVINHKHTTARIVSAKQWLICLYSRKVVSSDS